MILGIDLGTTNSAAGIWRDGETVLIPNALGHVLTPSVVGMADTGEVLVGLAARDRLSTHPSRTASAFKRHMGTNRVSTLGTREFRPEELSALILQSLKADAEAYLGEPVTEAVITVPAYFNDLQRKATQAAGTLAGLKVRRLVTEPTAAALAYGLTGPSDDEFLLVVDLGGGTFDVSLLHCFEGVTEVRATAGDTWLGGEDFVDVLVSAFMKEAGEPGALPPISAIAPIHGAVRRQAELAKRRLTDAAEATIVIAYGEREIRWDVSREAFERLSEPVLARVRLPIERALRDARIDPDTLSQVVLVGGASRMPMLRRLIGRLFKRLPLQHIDPDEAVARGAALCAGMTARSADLREVIMTDVAPFTLGIDVSDTTSPGVHVHGLFLPIIERNTVIPASRAKQVVTSANNQRLLRIDVYQGEGHQVKDNIRLGTFTIRCPPAPAGAITADIRFTYDTSGLLEVEATILTTGVRQRLVIEGNPGMLSRDEIASRLTQLSSLKQHPREAAAHRALMTRAERMFQEHLGDTRMQIGDALTGFVAALESQHPERIRVADEYLRRLLDRHDQELFL